METISRFLRQRYLHSSSRKNPPIVVAADFLFPGSSVAIKSISLPEKFNKDTLGLLSTAQRYLSLSHPNLARPVDVFIDPNTPTQLNLVSEFILGESPLTASRLLSTEAFLNLLGQVCTVLHYLHARGFAHLDLHPGNLLLLPPTDVNPLWMLKLIDVPFFNIRTIREHRDILSFSPNYAAPEILNGGSFDHRADLYSLGVLLFQLLVGDLPLRAKKDSSSSQHREILEDNRIDLVAPEFLGPIVKKLLSPELERRYTSAHFVYEDIYAHMKDKRLAFDTHSINGRTYCLSPLVTFPETEAELRELSDWYTTRSGFGSRSITINGPSAVGKTHFSRTVGFYLNALGACPSKRTNKEICRSGHL